MDLLEIAMIGIAVMVAVNVIAPKIGIASRPRRADQGERGAFAPTTLDWGRQVITTISVDPEERAAEGEDLRSERGELRLAVIELQRTQLLAIRDLGTYPSAVLEEMLTQLDADQLSLELRSTS